MRTPELNNWMAKRAEEESNYMEQTFTCEGCGKELPPSERCTTDWSYAVCEECSKLHPCALCGELTEGEFCQDCMN